MKVWKKGTCKSPEIMALVCMLHFCAAHNNMNVCVQHIPGVTNNIGDTLSRFQHHRFKNITPNANPQPGIIPAWPHQAFTAASCSADISYGVAQSTRSECLSNVLLPFQHYSHSSFISNPAVLLCGQNLISILKVYLAAIHLSI